MEESELIISHDKEADVAYLSFGKPRPSVSEEVDDYVLVRRDPKPTRSEELQSRTSVVASPPRGR
jgi:hypothetical protein